MELQPREDSSEIEKILTIWSKIHPNPQEYVQHTVQWETQEISKIWGSDILCYFFHTFKFNIFRWDSEYSNLIIFAVHEK